MKLNSTGLLMDLIFARFKYYRYYLLFKFLQQYLPKFKKTSSQAKQVVDKKVEKNPYTYLTLAVAAGMLISRLFKRKK